MYKSQFPSKTEIYLIAIHFGQNIITWYPITYSASMLSSLSDESKPLEWPPRAKFDRDILGLCVIICSYKYDWAFFKIVWEFDNI